VADFGEVPPTVADIGEVPPRRADIGDGPRTRRGWWRRRSLRFRITALATLAVAAFLALAGAGGIRVVTFVLYRGAEDAARAQAQTVAALVRANQVPNPLPAVTGTAAVQVLDGSGRVLGSSAGGDRLTALATGRQVAQLRDGDRLTLPATRLGGSVPLRVVGVAADSGSRVATVLVAIPVADVERTGQVLAVATLVVSVVALTGFALVCWTVTGSALRPVAEMRRGAARITAAGAGSRLPVPVADDEVRALAVTLNGMLDRLAAAATSQRAFVADAAHELRSPLASLRVQLEVERDHPDPAGRSELVADLLEDLTRLDRLTAALLDLAHLEAGGSGRGVGGVVAVDLAAAVREVVRSVPAGSVSVSVAGSAAGSAWASGSTDGELPVDPAETRVSADPAALSSVVTNLVSNAVRHASSRVVVSVIPRDGSAMVGLIVSDDGPGIAAADRARVFDRFTRLDSARDQDSGGAGLGLAIVARILAAHGATITLAAARAEPGAADRPGLQVTVRWPAAPAELPTATDDSASTTPPTGRMMATS